MSRIRLIGALFSVLALVSLATPGVAQITITPDGTSKVDTLGKSEYRVTFTIENNRSSTNFLDTYCGYTGSVVSCTIDGDPQPVIPAYGSVDLDVTFTVTHGTGTVTLDGLGIGGWDNGYFDVSIVAPPAPTVAVSPASGSVATSASQAYQQTFEITNIGTTSRTFTLTPSCTAPLSGCTTSTSQLTLAAGESGQRVLSYTSGSQGATGGSVRLIASDNSSWYNIDTGTVAVSIGAAGTTASATIAATSSDSTVAPDMCLTVATGAGTAYECGHARYSHALLPVRTYNKARAPVLLYNSEYASPHPVVTADITLPFGASIPTQMVVVLKTLAGATLDTLAFDGTDWLAGSTRRVALSFDASADTSQIAEIVVSATAMYGATTASAVLDTLALPIVNRSGSPFGAGVWIAGVEHLDPGTMTWIGGDGAVRRYASAATNIWKAPSITRLDSITRNASTGVYTRHLPHGVRVFFSATGRHDSTANRLGHVTRFVYDGSGRLDSIVVPSPSGNAPAYHFTYTGTSSVQIALGSYGTTTIILSSGRATEIRDPDYSTTGVKTVLGYSTSGNRLTSVVGRRGGRVALGYDAYARLVSDSVKLDATTYAVTQFTPAETRGRVHAIIPDSAYTFMNGPRRDTTITKVWIGRWGAPTAIENALGKTTTITRGNTTFPGLATSLTIPNGTQNGLVATASYDARGNLDTSTVVEPFGAAQGNAVTAYEWDSTWDFVTKVKPPMGDSVTMAYDGSTGNRLWQRNARGDTTKFSYLTNGQLWGVKTPLLAADSVAYDAQLGNLAESYTPARRLSTVTMDALGRVTRSTSPIDASHSLVHGVGYDALGRVVADTTIGPTMPTAAAESLFVRTYYNSAGLADSVARWAGPDLNSIGHITTSWEYDTAGRRTHETAPDGKSDLYAYDVAGNLVAHTTRQGKMLGMTYDALNRLATRSIPAVAYPRQAIYQTWQGTQYFPRYAGGDSLILPADAETFAYDDFGALTEAENSDARVSRTYYPGGMLKSDTLRIRTWATVAQGGNFTQHVYGLGYGYDLAGRRTWLAYPGALVPRDTSGDVQFDTLTYSYSAWGALSALAWRASTKVQFETDAEGRLDSLTWRSVPNLVDAGARFGYDDSGDGQLTHRSMHQRTATSLRFGGSSSTLIFDDSLSRSGRGTVQWATTHTDSTDFAYSGLGSLARMNRQARNGFSGNESQEEMTADALGNVRTSENVTAATASTHYYRALTGRDSITSATSTNPASEVAVFDSAGNRFSVSRSEMVKTPTGWQTNNVYARYYYGADGRLRVVDRRTSEDGISSSMPVDAKGVYENYRYDPLGRRILVRSRRDSVCAGACLSVIERYVWDGPQILYEIRYPGSDSASAVQLEQDSGAIGYEEPWTNAEPDTSEWELDTIFSHHYGRVAYVNGPSIDQPLHLIRMDYGDTNIVFPAFWVALHNNWRGHIADATIGGNLVSSHCKQTAHWNTADHSPSWDTIYVCVQSDWSPPYSAALKRKALNPVAWFGSLPRNQTDGSGQMYMRNRYYDPTTGRFTQEDPIGLAGGVNAYGFAAGDPVNFSDPFGLKVCFNGSPDEVRANSDAAKKATNTTFELDKQNCVKNVVHSGDTTELGRRFDELAADPNYVVDVYGGFPLPGSPVETSWAVGSRFGGQAWVGKSGYPYPIYGPMGCLPLGVASRAATFAHEVLGHVWFARMGGVSKDILDGGFAVDSENLYHAQAGEPSRCAY